MKRKKNNRGIQFGVAVVTMGTMTSICLVPMLAPARPPKGGPTASSALKAGGGEIPFELPILLIATDGTLELYDEPGGALRQTLDDEALSAQVIGGRNAFGHLWYRLRLEADGSTAWVIADEVAVESEETVRFYDFEFCAGSAAGPSGPCGNPIPLTADGIWLRWKYQALKAGDQVQWLLVVNGEQYAVPLDVWQGAPSGGRLVNLMEARPRAEPGLWTVKLYVNGEFITEGTVAVQ